MSPSKPAFQNITHQPFGKTTTLGGACWSYPEVLSCGRAGGTWNVTGLRGRSLTEETNRAPMPEKRKLPVSLSKIRQEERYGG